MESLVDEEYYDYHQEIATSCYGDMLHDDERNMKFGAALKSAINKVHLRGEMAHVLDIGTGTGLLAMLAVRYGADTVVACEMFQPVAACAKTIIEKNGLANKINVVAKHSTALTVGPNGDLPRRANILVSEVFDTELIGEGALQTFNHAHRVLLEENSIVIPSIGTIYGQIVESKSCLSWNKLNDWIINEKSVVNVPETVRCCPGAPSLHDIQLSQLPLSEFKPLTPRIRLFRFDFMRQKVITNLECAKISTMALTSGTAQVLFMWWDLIMDDENEILLSCAPVWFHPERPEVLPNGNPAVNIPWRDHWMQAVYFFPKEMEVSTGQCLPLRAYHDEFSLWFEAGDGGDEQAPICNCGFHLYASRTRIGALNDPVRRRVYLECLRQVSKERKYYIVFGDFSLLPMLIGKTGATKVLVLTKASSSLNENVLKLFIDANKLADIVIMNRDLASLVHTLKEDLVSKDISWKEVCILGEPFFQTSLVAWDSISFWLLVKEFFELVKPHVCPEDVDIFIQKLSIRACCVQFDDLHKISRPIQNCMGLDVGEFDNMISKSKLVAQNTPEPQPLWEYPCRAQSETITLASFDFTKPLLPEAITASSSFDVGNLSRIDGVAVWVEYHLLHNGIIYTGPTQEPRLGEYIRWDRFERQGVHIFEEPCSSDNARQVKCSISFHPETAKFNFSFEAIKSDTVVKK